ncbi:carboxylic ester hydrolase-8 [Diplogelasinospora grovesii]|uniref:Carboxylic ester hydrolase n=1 Tax=Diplogelasinospora grovesii TaxID=303347 RepID=A0AAN6MYE6_9PEZI|nr:carboxylic ester hydrolase-8 [Diplogelasinospora grovesii]
MSFSKFLPLALALGHGPLVSGLAAGAGACSAESFNFPLDQLNGTSSLGITASPVVNYTSTSLPPGTNLVGSYTVSYCNVTMTYTHPGWNDTIHVTVQLPAQDSWNGRLEGFGGGGYAASFGLLYSVAGVAEGFATVDTDAGHVKGSAQDSGQVTQTPYPWALTSPGQVNTALLVDWGSISLHEMAVIAKAAIEAFYGSQPTYSYFAGCSGGGRQAMMIAERYAGDFDGILAVAPAINIESFIPAGFWAEHVMGKLGYYPPACEVDAFTQAAIDACDELDGVQDSIIASPELCKFDPQSVVGQSFNCSGTTRQLTAEGATIVDAAWTGPRSAEGALGWFGVNKDAALTSFYILTECTSNYACTPSPTGLWDSWLIYLLAKDPEFDVMNMTDAQFFDYLNQTKVEYAQMLAAANPDLSSFKAAGGKLIIWQGLADEAIPPNGTIAFYQQVLQLDSDAQSFARFFEAPGVAHCYGGVGAIPNGAFDQLVSWVENGTAPDTLTAVDTSGNTRELCPYPMKQTYVSGDAADPTSLVFNCTLNPAASEIIADEFAFFTYE